jgi:hypothetical protein
MTGTQVTAPAQHATVSYHSYKNVVAAFLDTLPIA